MQPARYFYGTFASFSVIGTALGLAAMGRCDARYRLRRIRAQPPRLFSLSLASGFQAARPRLERTLQLKATAR